MEFNNYIDTKTPNDPMCEFQKVMKCFLNYLFPLCKLLISSIMPFSLRIKAFIVDIIAICDTLKAYYDYKFLFTSQRVATLYSFCYNMYI